MNTPQVVPQMQFDSLDDFKENSNNFPIHFLEDAILGKGYRKRPAFLRFKEKYPQLEKETTRAMGSTDCRKDSTWEMLFEAYKKMSNLVYEDDAYIRRPDLAKFLVYTEEERVKRPGIEKECLDTWCLCR